MRILLNGVGRIGKAILRIAQEDKSLDIVAINELNTNIDNITYSINYDSTYGKLQDKFEVVDDRIKNSHFNIKILNENSLEKINYDDLGIDIVIDASGAKVDCERLKKLTPKAFFLTHPNKNADINVIIGVNDENLNLDTHKVISTSSCNATALLPVLKFIDTKYKIVCADIATIHPLLNHQKALDAQCVGSSNREVECSFEFGRSSTQNIIPSKTTTIDACSLVEAKFNHKLIASNSFRVPTSIVGAINVSIFIDKETTKEELIEVCEQMQSNQKYNVIYNNYESLVSSDFTQCKHTSIIDHRFTNVVQKKMIKLVLWYDNEWGYASKVVDIIKKNF